MERLDLEGDEILRDTFDPFFFFCIPSNFEAFFKRSKWDVKDYTRLHYRVVYCTFYIRRLISSFLDEENIASLKELL